MPFIDSKPSEKLSTLLTNTELCKAVRRLSPVYQTSSLEAFHSVIIHFAPKYVPFSYHGMNCRYIRIQLNLVYRIAVISLRKLLPLSALLIGGIALAKEISPTQSKRGYNFRLYYGTMHNHNTKYM